MDLFTKNKSFNLILVLYFVLLPFVFFSSILDTFLLARQLLTTVLLFSIISLLLVKNKPIALFTLDKTVLLFLGFIVFCLFSFSKSQILDLSHAAVSKHLIFILFFMVIRHLIMNDLIEANSIKSYVILFGLLSIIIALLAFINKTIDGQNLFRQVNAMSGTFGNKNFLSSILFFLLFLLIVGCKDKSESISPKTSIGFEVLTLYPNPNLGQVAIQVFNESPDEYQLFIFDPEGRKIFSDIIPKKVNKDFRYDLKAKRAGSGIFTAILQTPTTTITKKIIVE